MRGLLTLTIVVAGLASGVGPGTFSEPGWTLLEANVSDGSTFYLNTTATGDSLTAIALFDAEGVLHGIGYSHYASTMVRPSVRVGSTSLEPRLDGHAEFPMPLEGVVAQGGRYYVLFYAGGLVDGYSWAAAGADVARIWSGSEVYYSNGADFTGGAALRVDGPASRFAVEEDAEYEFDIEGTFIGRVGSRVPHDDVGYQEQSLRLTTPSETRVCPCTTTRLFGAGSFGPGHYLVEMDNVEASVLSGDDLLWGADVRLT